MIYCQWIFPTILDIHLCLSSTQLHAGTMDAKIILYYSYVGTLHLLLFGRTFGGMLFYFCIAKYLRSKI
jgi:hypothetical protein